MTDLLKALNEFKPALAARYEAQVRYQFERMTKRLGPQLKGIGNDWTFARTWHGTVQPYARKEAQGYVIMDEALAAAAKVYAGAVIEEWLGKINAKLGELANAQVKRMDGVAFLITGERHGRKVAIEQQMIVNVSRLGTFYNQYPARIRVDGKPVSEAFYKRLGAAA